jgi:hypothetical protein
MAPLGRVMDIACDIVFQTGALFINSDVRVHKGTGTIYDNDARNIEQQIGAALRDQMLGVSMISDFTVVVDRTNNILTTQTVNIAVTITSRGYILQENVTISYENQAAA